MKEIIAVVYLLLQWFVPQQEISGIKIRKGKEVCSVITYFPRGKESEKEWMCVYVLTKSLCYTSEINTTL